MGNYNYFLIQFISRKKFDLEDFKKYVEANNTDGFFDEWCGLGNMELQKWNEYVLPKYHECVAMNIWKEYTNIKYNAEECFNYVLTTTMREGGNEDDLKYLVEFLQGYTDSIIYINGTYHGHYGEINNIVVNNIPKEQPKEQENELSMRIIDISNKMISIDV